jgi:hypothetical protein
MMTVWRFFLSVFFAVCITWRTTLGDQAAIFHIGKAAICPVLTVLEVRSGQKVQYENEEARKAGCE